MATKNTQRIEPLLSGIVFKENDVWIARCITIDHTAQADHPVRAIRECIEGVVADLEYAIEHDSLEYLQPAPVSDIVRYWRETDVQKRYQPRRISLPICSEGGCTSRAEGTAAFDRITSLVHA